jgi:hypothetical protein
MSPDIRRDESEIRLLVDASATGTETNGDVVTLADRLTVAFEGLRDGGW